MKLCGVVAEYNPFHNGHAWQLARARALSGCDGLIVCMGGGVSQRGEVMLLDKWTRARMALEHGADVVVELPALFAVRPAEAFARGGVLTLAGLGVDALSFGCETDDLALLRRLARALADESAPLSAETRAGLMAGKSHARARGEAAERLYGLPEGLIGQPNVTLGLEYLRALDALGRPVEVFVVPRRGGYHDAALGEYASASAIRAALETPGADLGAAMPADCLDALRACLADGRVARPDRLDAALIHRLRTAGPEALAALADVTEGMERLFIRHAALCGSRDALLARVKCKRYTYARLSRFCACALLGLTRADTLSHPAPEYARVLGFRKDAHPLLRRLSETSALPLVTDPVALKGSPLFRFDSLATDLQALAMDNPDCRAAGQDFTRQIVIV